MEATYNLKAIVLSRRPFAEADGRVTVYSRERGKLELAVKGVRKIKSKLAGHLEPFNQVELMAAVGRQFDYAAAAVSENCRLRLKSDLAKLAAAGAAVKIFDRLIKPGVADETLYDLLASYLKILNLADSAPAILNSLFIFKLLARLGYKPELNKCVKCGGKILPAGMKFDPARGGLICGRCGVGDGLTMGENSVKLLRLAEKRALEKLVKIKIDKQTEKQIAGAVDQFFRYHF